MEYLIKSTAILTIFYVFYKVFLQSETFFQSIRSYFLVGIFSALTFPLITIPKYIQIEPLNLSSLDVTDSTPSLQSPTFDWIQLIVIIYLLGVVFFSIRFLAQLSSLLWFLYTHQKTKKGKYIFVKTTKNIAPFSFFNYIVYNSDKYNNKELEQILIHEKTHTNHLHSIDIFLSHCMAILNWFNPFIWLYNKEMQKNLEFIADEYTQNITEEKKKYQYLLLKTISLNYKMALTTNFYNSLIKKRIDMLQKNRSNKTMQIKFALIIPILIAFVFTFNTKVIAQQKKIKTVEIQSDFDIEIITKDFQKKDLENLKNTFSKKEITFKYKKLKYNSNNELTSISLSVKNKKGNQANLSQNGSEPINPIQIKINNETGAMSVGNISGKLHEHENVFFSSGNNGIHKTITIKNDRDHDMIFISSDSTETIEHNDSYIFYSDENHGKKGKYIVKVKTDSDIHFGDEKSESTKIWISTNGDTTKLKKVELIEIHEDNDVTQKIIIKKNRPTGKHDKFIIKSDDKTNINHGKMIFIDSDGKKPLFFVNGKEIENGKLEDINPNDIKSMSVLKGEKAIEKYGAKGKNGVIEIITKKEK